MPLESLQGLHPMHQYTFRRISSKLYLLYLVATSDEFELLVTWHFEDNTPLLTIYHCIEGTKPIHTQYCIKSISITNQEIDIEFPSANHYRTQFIHVTRINIPIFYAYILFNVQDSQGILCCVVNVDDIKQGNIAESNKSNASI